MEFLKLDEKGLVYSDYPTILTWLQNQYKQIYGNDVYLEADSQDGQWIAVQALAMYDMAQVAASVYNSFSPLTAQSDALSRNVKINGIARHVASKSTVDLKLIGQVGATIKNGVVEDALEQKWYLPATVIIPEQGEIIVTATADREGDVTATANSITKISTPTLGWHSVTNPLAATVGAAIETDAELRRRQTYSTALPSLSVFNGTLGAVFSLPDVKRVRGYENDTSKEDEYGISPHSIALVVDGGDAQEIAKTIAMKKTPGTGTYGDVSVISYDRYGAPNRINFFRPQEVEVHAEIIIKPLPGYSTQYADDIAQAVSKYINALEIGESILLSKLYVPANLPQKEGFRTFDITSIKLGRSADNLSATSLAIAFNELAVCNASHIIMVEQL